MDKSKFLKAYGAATGRPFSGLAGSAFTSEAIMSRRKRKGKIQSGDQLGDLSNLPQYIQDMAMTGRDDNGNISSKAAARGAGFTNKEIAEAAANYGQLQDERDYEQSVWEERESLQGQVKQAQEAGINPAMLAGGYSASGGTPVTGGGDVGVSGESSYDEFGGGMDMLSQLIGLFSGAAQITNQVRGTNQQIKASKQQVQNETETTRVNNANTEAQTALIQEQTKGQQNLNNNFWRKVDDEHAESIVRQALGNANIGKIEFDKGMSERMAKIAEESNEIKKFEAESGRMLATQQCAKMIAEVQQMYYENQNLIKDAANKDQQWLIFSKQLKIMNEEITAASTRQTQTSLAKMYGVPDEWAFLCYATEQKMSDENFNLWLQGFRESLVNKATAVDYVQESTFRLFGVQFGPTGKQTRAGSDGATLLYKH